MFTNSFFRKTNLCDNYPKALQFLGRATLKRKNVNMCRAYSSFKKKYSFYTIIVLSALSFLKRDSLLLSGSPHLFNKMKPRNHDEEIVSAVLRMAGVHRPQIEAEEFRTVKRRTPSPLRNTSTKFGLKIVLILVEILGQTYLKLFLTHLPGRVAEESACLPFCLRPPPQGANKMEGKWNSELRIL